MSSQRNKSLPDAPPCFEHLEKENTKLKEQNKFLQDVIEVMYVQNQQFSHSLETRRSRERELKNKVDRLLKSIGDLSSTQARNQVDVRELDKERQDYWKEFCQQKTLETGGHLWKYLEKIKSDIIVK